MIWTGTRDQAAKPAIPVNPEEYGLIRLDMPLKVTKKAALEEDRSQAHGTLPATDRRFIYRGRDVVQTLEPCAAGSDVPRRFASTMAANSSRPISAQALHAPSCCSVDYGCPPSPKTKTEDIRLARATLSRLGLIGRSKERARRSTESEINALLDCFDNKTNTIIRVIRFAIATASRLEEIFKIEWSDVDMDHCLHSHCIFLAHT